MAKVDNFKLVESLFYGQLQTKIKTDSDLVILGRIIRRKKENPDKKSEYIVKRYTFVNLEQFIESQGEIKELCRMYNARFYLSVNIKSMKEIAYDISERVPNLIRNEQFYFFRRIFDDVADANLGVKGTRLWVFDVDDVEHINVVITHLVSAGTFNLHSAGVIHTLNGAHLLMRPHDIRYMDAIITDIPGLSGLPLKLSDIVDIKKNAMTLVYYDGEDK